MLISPLLEIYTYIVVASIVLTWLPVNGITQSLTRPVDALTEPLLKPIRKALPQGGQNWASMVLYFGLVVLRGWVES
jgi:uncharacterized protein YggT (Ycf19 family)